MSKMGQQGGQGGMQGSNLDQRSGEGVGREMNTDERAFSGQKKAAAGEGLEEEGEGERHH